eukprot:TRINITY_DN64480_c0_g1_i1.p1 TRINITY_DN64480_c0_g1~~TRINITY_DN64480_c0_g1_i1.p1  ORF type:complete len:473 (+),score=18.53 TRINITY_DN64480_c0_g1_i1:130-1419(+)
MESGIYTCPAHGKLNELVCETCGRYLCPECITNHTLECPNASYNHVFGYASTKTLTTLKYMEDHVKKNSEETKQEYKVIMASVEGLSAKLSKVACVYSVNLKRIESLLKKLGVTGLFRNESENCAKNVIKTLEAQKSQLIQALKENKRREVLKITQSVEAFQAAESIGMPFLKDLKQGAYLLEETTKLSASAIDNTKSLIAKLHRVGTTQYCKDWKCDRNYYNDRMHLSKTCLKFGCESRSGPVAIIGDKAISEGLMAFEVTPIRLEGKGKDGFGVIELDKFLAYWLKDKPPVLIEDHIIGLLYPNVPKNMTGIVGKNIVLNSKYYVQVNMSTGTVRITGNEVSLYGNLKFGVEYVPCFVCGQYKSKMSIKPLSSFDYVDEILSKKEERKARREARVKAKKEAKKQHKMITNHMRNTIITNYAWLSLIA